MNHQLGHDRPYPARTERLPRRLDDVTPEWLTGLLGQPVSRHRRARLRRRRVQEHPHDQAAGPPRPQRRGEGGRHPRARVPQGELVRAPHRPDLRARGALLPPHQRGSRLPRADGVLRRLGRRRRRQRRRRDGGPRRVAGRLRRERRPPRRRRRGGRAGVAGRGARRAVGRRPARLVRLAGSVDGDGERHRAGDPVLALHLVQPHRSRVRGRRAALGVRHAGGDEPRARRAVGLRA